MCALRVYTGNHLETLVEMLSHVLREPLSSPTDAEIVVVQSKGMEHWISLELARRLGICANIIFPFPNRFVEDIDRRVTGTPSPSPSFELQWMSWRILRLLEGSTTGPEFRDIREYLAGDNRGLRRFQLAHRIADTLDQYLVYRPDMIARWEKGEDGGWQASIWRKLIRELPPGGNRAARARAVMKALESSGASRDLPLRVSVFGISALPRFHMDILAAVARFVPVNLFVMNPCREYWGDIVSERHISRAESRASGRIETSDLHLEKGHPLLASTGMMGRDFFEMIHDYPVDEQELYVDPGEDSLLHALQSDILFLRDRGGTGDKTNMHPGDDSILVHSCHSPLREVEVLRDRLLELFESNPGVGPADVLVTMPDIEGYSPFIRAVFDAPAAEGLRIPYSIADRSVGRESSLITAFMSLLDLGRERFALSRVLAVLESPSILRRFDLSANDLEIIRTWAVSTGIRWGLDGQDRAASGLPPFEENTWSAGLHRMLLGYAMAGGDRNTFAGILPFDNVEGGHAEVLEKLLDFTSAVYELLPQPDHPRPPDAWGHTLNLLLERFFDPDQDTEREASILRRTINELIEASDPSGPDAGSDLHLEAVQWFMGRRFEREGFGFGFMTGGITFCAMLPMRSIPFRVICCLGLDGNAFPRTRRAPEFDLISRHPRVGDRSRRKDDRYLFLEMILSARDQLHLSYVGQSLQDNTSIPPSPLVTELLEVIHQGFETPGETILDRIVVRHLLQPFNPEYFLGKDDRLYSYSEDNLRAARALVGGQQALSPFFPEDLPEPGHEWNNVDLEDMIRFFRNPSEFLLRRRLGVVLKEPEGLPEDREPFSVEGLERYAIGRDLVERCRKGEDPFEGYDSARASGAFPHGNAGRVLFEGLAREAVAFVEQTEAFMPGDTVMTVPVDLEIGEFRLNGHLDVSPSCGLSHRRFATLKTKDRLNGWIRHLVLNASEAAPPEAMQSVVIGLDVRGARTRWTGVRFGPLSEAHALLLKLLLLYKEGLRRPLPFFPNSSWAYAGTLLSGESPEHTAGLKARQAWEGNRFSKGEKKDPYMNLCFRNLDPIETEEFRRISLDILGPIIANEKTPA